MQNYSCPLDRWIVGRLEGGKRVWIDGGWAALRFSSAIPAVEEMRSPSVVSWGEKARDGGITQLLPGIHEVLQGSSIWCLPQMAKRAGPQLWRKSHWEMVTARPMWYSLRMVMNWSLLLMVQEGQLLNAQISDKLPPHPAHSPPQRAASLQLPLQPQALPRGVRKICLHLGFTWAPSACK